MVETTELEKRVDDLSKLIGSHIRVVEQHMLEEVAFRKEVRPLLDIYSGSKFARNFVIGASTIVGSIVAFGAGVYIIIQWLKHLA